MQTDDSQCLRSTRRWIRKVVVGLELCPFAAPVLRLDALLLRAVSGDLETCLHALAGECQRLERQPELDTLLLVLSSGYTDFADYLELLDLAERLLDDSGYRGVFQLASFHPRYQFAGSAPEDVENYTNRSPYPLLQLLRESSVTRALAGYGDPAAIPQRNIECMQAQGIAAMRRLLRSC